MTAETTDSSFQLPSDHITKFDNEGLWLESETWELAKEICEEVELHPNCPSSRPSSIAAAALYIASVVENDKRAQTVIAESTDTSVKAIRENHPEIAKILDEDSDLIPYSLENFYQKRNDEQQRRGPVDALRALIR